MGESRIGSTFSSGPAVTCIKTLLTGFNFIFWLSGIAILALGIWTKVELYMYMQLSTIYFEDAPYILIGVGAGIVVFGSFGCCCTFKGNSVLLYMYAVFLVLVFIAELSSGAAGFIYRGKIEGGFHDGLRDSLQKYGQDESTTKAVDGLQENLRCCGRDSYMDWFNSPWEKSQIMDNKTKIVPKSCCNINKNKCVNYNLDNSTKASKDVYTNGCYNTVTDFMQGNMALLGGIALGISFFQLIGALLACCLAKNINKAKYEQVK